MKQLNKCEEVSRDENQLSGKLKGSFSEISQYQLNWSQELVHEERKSRMGVVGRSRRSGSAVKVTAVTGERG